MPKPEGFRLFPAMAQEFERLEGVGSDVARRRKQKPAWIRREQQAALESERRPRSDVRRPVRRGFSWRSLAWVGGGLAVLIAATALVVASASSRPAPAPPLPTVSADVLARGHIAPDFTATRFGGGQLSISGLKGKPVLVNFFASWCTQCAHELPFMEESYQRHKDSGFVIVGVNSLETGDGVAFYHQFGLTFPAVYDPGNPGRIAVAYGVTFSLPVSVFIGKDGRVDLIQLGALTPELLEQEIQKLS